MMPRTHSPAVPQSRSLAVSQSRSLAVSHDSRSRSVRSAWDVSPSVRPFRQTLSPSPDRLPPSGSPGSTRLGPPRPYRHCGSRRLEHPFPSRHSAPRLPAPCRPNENRPVNDNYFSLPAATFRPETASRPARSPLSDRSDPLRHAQTPPPVPSRPASGDRSQETGARIAKTHPKPPISTPSNPLNPKQLATQCPNRTRLTNH